MNIIIGSLVIIFLNWNRFTNAIWTCKDKSPAEVKPTCVENQGKCELDRDCCKGFCSQFQKICCQLEPSKCNFDSDCCTGHCFNGVCRPPPPCASSQEKCELDSDCCNGRCNPLLRDCSWCKSDQMKCKDDKECCSEKCVSGTCRCLVTGACDHAGQCCGECDSLSLFCVSRNCGLKGTPCADPSECCSKFCDAGPDGVGCICLPDGTKCKHHEGCCSHFCQPTDGRCGCKADGELCTGKECCSGSCSSVNGQNFETCHS